MQTTLLGLAIAFIIALIAALIGPYFIDWNKFRPQFEAEASRIIGAPVRVGGELDARLLPTPTLRLRSVTVGGPNDLGKVRADKLNVEFSLGELMRGNWRANELTVSGLAVDLGLDPQGRIDLPETNGTFDLGSLSIDRLNLTGRIALHDAASRSTLELSDVEFSGDVRSLAGAVRGDGNFTVKGTRYPFRVSSGQGPDGNGTRVHLNIDPGERPLSADLDGVLSFAARAPRFEGSLTLAVPPPPKAKAGEASPTPWRISARIKADHAAAQLEQIEASYGAEDRALKFAGSGDIRFGAAPLLHAVLAARQLDADRSIAPENAKDGAAVRPLQLLPMLRTAIASLPHAPIATRIEASAEQIMLGGRPLQNLSAGLHGDADSWTIERLDLRAPGGTQLAFTAAPAAPSAGVAGALDIDSADPDALSAWLQGRSDAPYFGQRPLRLHGNVSLSSNRVAIDALKAEINGSTIEGHAALSGLPAGGSRVEATLKANRLDVGATVALVRSLAGPQGAWPEEAAISLDVGSAISAAQEFRPFAAKLSYDPRTITLEQLKFGQANGVSMEGSGNFDRTDTSGKLSLNANAASLGQISALVAPLAPSLASRLDSLGTVAGPARLGLAFELGKSAEKAGRASARATISLDAPQLKGTAAITAQPELAAIRGIDVEKLRHSEVDVETKLSTARGDSLLALLGLDRVVAAGGGTVQFNGSARGAWGAPLRLNAKIWGAGIDADAQGTADPWAQAPKASLDLRARSVDLAPLLAVKPSDASKQNVRLFAHVSLDGNKLTFDDLDSIAAGSRLRGHLALTLDEAREINGELGLDTLDLAPVFAAAIGSAGHGPADPLGAGFLKGWHGRIGFEALRGELPGGIELHPVSGTLKVDGQSLSLSALKGGIGGGQATASIDARQGTDGIALNVRLDLAGVDGSALRYRGMRMPTGRTSAQMTFASQGRSVAALVGAMSGSGTVTLESAKVPGLDPQAFDVAVRASDDGQATDDTKLRQIVWPVLSAGTLPVASAQIPFNIRDGRLRVDAATLTSSSARAIVSGGYDILADQADIRVSLASTAFGSASSRPEIQIFAVGSPDKMKPTLDMAGLSSWLAVREIDRETRRLDSIERSESGAPSSNAPATATLPTPANPDVAPPDQPHSDTPAPSHNLHRFLPKPKPAIPLPPSALSQQVAPLPPPIVVRPAPGPPPAKPRPRLPMILTPATPNP